MLEPPEELIDGLTASVRVSVVQWWNTLSAEQRQTVEQILDAPNCTLQFHQRVGAESESAIELFSDDWDTHWADNWESDFRKYLTEHPELSLDFFSFLVQTR